MPQKNPVSNIIDCIEKDSPVEMVESFVKAMQTKVGNAVDAERKRIAESLLSYDAKPILEDAEYPAELDGINDTTAQAIDYVIGCIEDDGEQEMLGAINRASGMFGVKVRELQDYFSDAQETVAESYEGFLGSLRKGVKQNRDAVVTFDDKAKAIIPLKEAQAVLKVYLNLKENNQSVMLQMMRKDQFGFSKLVAFAESQGA